MKKITLILGFILCGTLMITSCGFIDDGIRTAHKEYDPSAMLTKYEWFKAQNQLINVANENAKSAKATQDKIVAQFERDNGKDHSKWNPMTSQRYQEKIDLYDQQVLATVSTYNKLVGDYNTRSSEFNWQSFNKDNLPQMFQEIH